MRYIVGLQEHIDYLHTFSLESGRKAMLGDPAKFPSMNTNITAVHIDIADAERCLERLPRDRMKTEHAKHAFAKDLADWVVHRVGTLKKQAEAKSKELLTDADALADAAFYGK